MAVRQRVAQRYQVAEWDSPEDCTWHPNEDQAHDQAVELSADNEAIVAIWDWTGVLVALMVDGVLFVPQ